MCFWVQCAMVQRLALVYQWKYAAAAALAPFPSAQNCGALAAPAPPCQTHLAHRWACRRSQLLVLLICERGPRAQPPPHPQSRHAAVEALSLFLQAQNCGGLSAPAPLRQHHQALRQHAVHSCTVTVLHSWPGLMVQALVCVWRQLMCGGAATPGPFLQAPMSCAAALLILFQQP